MEETPPPQIETPVTPAESPPNPIELNQEPIFPKPKLPLKPILLILIGLVILSLLVALAIRYFSFDLTSPTIPSVPTPTITPTLVLSPESTIAPTPDSTANWKIFSNGNYLYSIKYSPDWPTVPSIEPGQKTRPIGLHEAQLLGQVVYLSKHLPEVKPPYLQIESLQYQSLTDFENKQTSGCSEPTFTVTKSNLYNAPLIIGHRVSPDEPGQPYSTGHQYCALIFHKNTIYILDWAEGSFEDSGLFNQILSTFRFLE